MLNQKLQQKLLQKLSPADPAYTNVTVPTIALEQRIKQELRKSCAEEGEEENEEETTDEQEEEIVDEQEGEEKTKMSLCVTKKIEFAFDDYVERDEIPLYRLVVQQLQS